MHDRQEISDLISKYGSLHDRLMVGPTPTAAQAVQFEKDALEWESIFTDDVEAVFTLTTTHGNKGFADVFRHPRPVSGYETGQWLGSNYCITDLTGDSAVGHSTFTLAFVYQRVLPDRHYDFGGNYDWRFRKVEGVWKISFVKPNTVWTAGADHSGVTIRDKQGYMHRFAAQ
ncbi:hypothetical protein RQP46_009462 [Phenoliferia psychrophenolica]